MRRVDEDSAADVDTDVVEVVEEHQVAGGEVAARHMRAGVPLRAGVVGQRDAELPVDVHDQARAIEAGGAGAAPDVGHAEVLLRERGSLLPERAGRRWGVGAAASAASASAAARAAAPTARLLLLLLLCHRGGAPGGRGCPGRVTAGD